MPSLFTFDFTTIRFMAMPPLWNLLRPLYLLRSQAGYRISASHGKMSGWRGSSHADDRKLDFKEAGPLRRRCLRARFAHPRLGIVEHNGLAAIIGTASLRGTNSSNHVPLYVR